MVRRLQAAISDPAIFGESMGRLLIETNLRLTEILSSFFFLFFFSFAAYSIDVGLEGMHGRYPASL